MLQAGRKHCGRKELFYIILNEAKKVFLNLLSMVKVFFYFFFLMYDVYKTYRESARESSCDCFVVKCQRGNVSLCSIRDETQAAVCLACEVRLVISLSCGEGKRMQCTGRLKRVSVLD